MTSWKGLERRILPAAKIAKAENPVADRKRAEVEAVTLGKAVEAYLSARDLKPLTVHDVRASMKTLKSWDGRRLLDITPEAVEKRHRELSRTSPARANLTMRYLRAILNFATEAYRFAGRVRRDDPFLTAAPGVR